MEIKSIYRFDTAWDLLQEYDGQGVDLSGQDEDILTALQCVDDYEDFGYIVINGDTVIVTDGRDGGPVIVCEPLATFADNSLKYAADLVED